MTIYHSGFLGWSVFKDYFGVSMTLAFASCAPSRFRQLRTPATWSTDSSELTYTETAPWPGNWCTLRFEDGVVHISASVGNKLLAEAMEVLVDLLKSHRQSVGFEFGLVGDGYGAVVKVPQEAEAIVCFLNATDCMVNSPKDQSIYPTLQVEFRGNTVVLNRTSEATE